MNDQQTPRAIAPLNGIKTHPLTAHARGVLADLAKAPLRAHLINPGVINRLRREHLATVDVRTRLVSITDEGRAIVAAVSP
jgi:hypothetical protein